MFKTQNSTAVNGQTEVTAMPQQRIDDTLDISEIMAFDLKMKDLVEIDVEELMNFNIDWDESV